MRVLDLVALGPTLPAGNNDPQRTIPKLGSQAPKRENKARTGLTATGTLSAGK